MSHRFALRLNTAPTINGDQIWGPVILTIIGVLMIVESLLYLIFIPQKVARVMLAYFNNPCGTIYAELRHFF